MYTQRFGKVGQRQTAGETSPAMLSQYSQTQVSCPVTKSISFRISSTPNLTSKLLSPDPVKKVIKSTQTTLSLNASKSDLELKVLNVTHRVIDPQKAKHVAIQTGMELYPSKSRTDISVQTSESITKFAPASTVTPITPSKQNTSLNAGVSPVEIEKQKKEELLAKLRQIDGIKNPPESKPIESATRRIYSDKSEKQQQPFQPGEGSVTSRTKVPERGPFPASNHPPDKVPPDTSQGTTSQGSGSQAGIQNLLLGESQPFQAGLMLNASRASYQPVNPPETSLTQNSAQTFSNSGQSFSSLFGLNGVQTKPQAPAKRSSLFNLTGGQMTKASTNLSSLQEGRLHEEERKGTVPVDFSKKFGDSTPSSRQKSEGPMKSTSKTSIGSLQSWPDTIQNLHVGKPAYSTEGDPFGRKHVAQSKQSKEYKPLHGRRAGTQQDILPDELTAISENHPGSTTLQKNSIKPQSGGQRYPWEVPVDVQLRDGKEGQAKSLLPFRPKQSNGFGIMPEPDDLEHVML